MSKKKKLSVLELINKCAADEEHKDKVTVLPLMCGTGKSTAISYKIRECIESNTGILIVTDRTGRLQKYLEPDPRFHNELNDYLNRDETKKKISMLVSGKNLRKELGRMSSCPVLLMTTQRYFSLETDELIEQYLKWDNGQRQLIIFDEQPELYTDSKLDLASINSLEAALIDKLSNLDSWGDRFGYYVGEWTNTKRDFVVPLLDYRSSADSYTIFIPGSDEHISSLPFYNDETETVDEDAIEKYIQESDIDPRQLDDPVEMVNAETGEPEEVEFSSLEEKRDYLRKEYQDHLKSLYYGVIAEAKYEAAFKSFFKPLGNDTKQRMTSYDSEAYKTLKALIYKKYNDVVFYHIKKKKETGYLVSMNNRRSMTPKGTKIIVLDGTADLTPDYKQDYITMEDCSSYRRPIPNLHIRIVNEKTSKDRLLTKDTNYTDAVIRFIKDQTHIDEKTCIFTYKLISKMLAAEIKAEAEAEAAEELVTADKQNLEGGSDTTEKAPYLTDDDLYNSEIEDAYLGNLRGLNDFQDFRVFCQIGLLRKPSSYYISHYYERRPSIRKDICYLDNATQIKQLKALQFSSEYLDELYSDMLADVEQNIFRAPIRSSNYKDDVYYYLLFDTTTYSQLVEMIKSRFTDCYGADVEVIDKPIELHQQLAGQKTRNGEPTIAAKCLTWISSLQTSYRFSIGEMAKALGLTTKQINKSMEGTKGKELREMLDFMKDPNSKRKYYIKR